MARPSPGCTNASPSTASTRPSRCGTPTSRKRIDFFDRLEEVPDNAGFDNGFKAQWEMFLRHVAEDAPWPYGLEAGAKGVQLATPGCNRGGSAAGSIVPVSDI